MRLAAGNLRNLQIHAAAIAFIHSLDAVISPPVHRIDIREFATLNPESRVCPNGLSLGRLVDSGLDEPTVGTVRLRTSHFTFPCRKDFVVRRSADCNLPTDGTNVSCVFSSDSCDSEIGVGKSS